MNSYSVLNTDTTILPLPWIKLDTIEVVFNQPMGPISVGSLSGLGVNTLTYAPDGVSQPSPSSAVWTFDTPFETDKVRLILSGIEDQHGRALNNGVDESLLIGIVLGDATRDGETTVGDRFAVGNRVGEVSTPEPSPYDINGDVEVTVGDRFQVGINIGQFLPIADPPLMLQADAIGPGTHELLTEEGLQAVLGAAVDRFVMAGLSPSVARHLEHSVSLQIVDFNGSALGGTVGSAIRIDRDAAGWGWYVDSTPTEDSEFEHSFSYLAANEQSAAYQRMDLLTVVMHELGHVLGKADLASNGDDLMSRNLSAGQRRLPQDDFFADSRNLDGMFSGIHGHALRRSRFGKDPRGGQHRLPQDDVFADSRNVDLMLGGRKGRTPFI